MLKTFEISSLFVGGLATDYCVKWTVLDALKFGYKVTLLLDAITGVDANPGDSKDTLDEMIRLGARKTTFEKLHKMMAGGGENNRYPVNGQVEAEKQITASCGRITIRKRPCC